MDYETGAVVLVALAAFKIIEVLVSKVTGRDNVTHDRKLEHVGEMVNSLYHWHKPSSDGVQSWKVPSDFGKLLQEIRDGIRDLLTEVRRQNGKTQ